MSPSVIREMILADYDSVFAFWREQEGIGLNDSDSREGVAAYLKRNPGMSLVAHTGGKLVGTVLCGHDGRRGYLHHVAVAKSQRGKGLGKTLVARCLEILRESGIHKCNIFVWASNDNGQQFWRAVGYEPRADLMMMQRSTAALVAL